MPTTPPPLDLHQEHQQILKEHYTLFYQILAKGGFSSKAAVSTADGIQYTLTGIPFSSHNAVLEHPKESSEWDSCIKKQIQFFRSAEVPFAWHVDEDTDRAFEEKLRAHGFKEGGIFQGVIGMLPDKLPAPAIPDGWSLELVKDEKGMNEFHHLVSVAFKFDEKVSNMYRKAMLIGAMSNSPRMYHWIARHDGKAVSAVTTLVSGEHVSFWNGASLPEYRRQGFSTALRRYALQDAVAKGCKVGMSYLPADSLALGICRQLGYQPKWRFRVFVSP